MQHKSPRFFAGISLIELLTVLSIIGVIAAVATPSFVGLIQKFRTLGEANALAGAIAVARSEAIRQGAPVTLCISADGTTCAAGEGNWLTGWMIFATPEAAPGTTVRLRVQNRWKGSDQLVATAATTSVLFNREGFPSGLPGGTVTFQVDTSPANPAARHCVTLSSTGRREILTHGSGVCP